MQKKDKINKNYEPIRINNKEEKTGRPLFT